MTVASIPKPKLKARITPRGRAMDWNAKNPRENRPGFWTDIIATVIPQKVITKVSRI